MTDRGDGDLGWALAMLAARRDAYVTYRDYYEGRHPLGLSTKKFRSAFGQLFRALNYNRCRAVIAAHVHKLALAGFDVEEGPAAAGEEAMAIWRRNRMDRRQAEIYQEALTLGDAYAVVWPGEDGLARIYPNPGDRMIVRYAEEEPDRVELALKTWRLRDGRWRVTLYRPGWVEKYVTTQRLASPPVRESQLIPWQEPDGEPWPLPYPWGESLGVVPVFHFATMAPTGGYGTSELRDVIGPQDALNKALADMVVTGEFHAYPQRWAVGVMLEQDETGQTRNPFESGENRLFWTADPEAKFGSFPMADLRQFVEVQDAWDAKIARVTGVPVHWLGMAREFPSGEALRTAESPFTHKIGYLQTAYGNVWEDCLEFCRRIEGRAPARLSALWRPAEPRSDAEFWTVAQLKIEAGIPEEQIWAEAGYSAQQIAEFKRLREERKAEQLAAFDAGRVPGIGPGDLRLE